MKRQQRISTAAQRELAGGLAYGGVLTGALGGLLGGFLLALPGALIGLGGFAAGFAGIRCPNCGARTSLDRYAGKPAANHDLCPDCDFDLTTRWGLGDRSPAWPSLWRTLGRVLLGLVIALAAFRAWEDDLVRDRCLDAGGRMEAGGRCDLPRPGD